VGPAQLSNSDSKLDVVGNTQNQSPVVIDARRRLKQHIAVTEARQTDHRPREAETWTVALGRTLVPSSARFRARMLTTNLMTPRERRQATKLQGHSPLLIHLGCQNVNKEGWVNVDLAGYPVELRWNLLRPLPFAAGTVDAMFHEHLLEHFSLKDGLALAQDWHRVLKPGGILRIGVPDAGAYVASYSEPEGETLRRLRPEAATKLLAVSAVFYWPHHLTMYDFETLQLLLTAAGFEYVERRKFGDTTLRPSPDSPHRRDETLYVEAVKYGASAACDAA
jgi:predicted SAM-dependent methyltransferase